MFSAKQNKAEDVALRTKNEAATDALNVCDGITVITACILSNKSMLLCSYCVHIIFVFLFFVCVHIIFVVFFVL